MLAAGTMTKGEQIAAGYFGTWDAEMRDGFRGQLAAEIDQAIRDAVASNRPACNSDVHERPQGIVGHPSLAKP